jgi:hypothetical protein
MSKVRGLFNEQIRLEKPTPLLKQNILLQASGLHQLP